MLDLLATRGKGHADAPRDSGRTVTGWPVTVIRRGEIVVEDGELRVKRGSGVFLRCDISEAARPLGILAPELDPETNFGVQILPEPPGNR